MHSLVSYHLVCVCEGDRQPDNRLYELCLIKFHFYSVTKLMMVSWVEEKDR